MCVDVHMTLSFCTLTHRVFLCSLCVRLCPKLHYTESSCLSIITLITLETELFTTLNSFVGAVKTKKLKGAPFLFELVAVVS